jgi:hypothetical protein
VAMGTERSGPKIQCNASDRAVLSSESFSILESRNFHANRRKDIFAHGSQRKTRHKIGWQTDRRP